MGNLTRASHELFRRGPDERYESLVALWECCNGQKEQSTDRWHAPGAVELRAADTIELAAGSDGAFLLNDWSFSQLCRMHGVAKDTVNRLSTETASRVFAETRPGGNKPLQLLTTGNLVRSIHGTQYTRLCGGTHGKGVLPHFW
jgi:hypothetical protein